MSKWTIQLSPNSWRHFFYGIKPPDRLAVCKGVARDCGLEDGHHLEVEITFNGLSPLEFSTQLTSGCEIRIPRQYQNAFKGIKECEATLAGFMAKATADRIEADLEALKQEEDYIPGKEGKRQGRWVNYYERNPRLRKSAIAFHGITCRGCDFNFEKVYGEYGKDYIEVHHLKMVSSLTNEENIDPKNDMTVVCSNCHRMIHHRRDKPLTIAELKTLIQETNSHR